MSVLCVAQGDHYWGNNPLSCKDNKHYCLALVKFLVALKILVPVNKNKGDGLLGGSYRPTAIIPAIAMVFEIVMEHESPTARSLWGQKSILWSPARFLKRPFDYHSCHDMSLSENVRIYLRLTRKASHLSWHCATQQKHSTSYVVSHCVLLTKLARYEVPRKAYEIISSYTCWTARLDMC